MYSLVLAVALSSSVSAPEHGFFWGWHGYYGPRPVVVTPVAYLPYGAWFGYYPSPGFYPSYWGQGCFAPPCPAYPVCDGPVLPVYAWTTPAAPAMPRAAEAETKDKDEGEGKVEDEAKAESKTEENENEPTLPPARIVRKPRGQAMVVVQAPLDVVLTFNGVKLQRTAERVTLTTPVLKPGKPFHYKVVAFAVRDGKRVQDDRIVVVRAGKQTVVDFTEMGTAE